MARFAAPGLTCVSCWVSGGRNLNLQTLQTDVKIATRTKDNVFVTIDLSIQWAVIQGFDQVQDLSKVNPKTMKATSDKAKKPSGDSDGDDSFGEHGILIFSAFLFHFSFLLFLTFRK